MPPFPESRFERGLLTAPDRILAATDLTDGDYLIPHIIAQAKASNAHVTLVHAILPANLLPMEAGALSCFDQEKIDAELRSQLQGMADEIRRHGVRCEAIAEHGFATDVVRQQIAKTGANRLIMGTHGRRKLAQVVLGSVASDLIRTVEIPVLAVGPQAHRKSHQAPRSILHPVSLAGDYKRTAEFALDLAQANRAELTLLHVLDPDSERCRADAMTALSALAPNGETLVPPVYTSVAHGNLIEEILYAASRANADWIVVGIEKAVHLLPFEESTAYKLLAVAGCPVLTCPHQAPAAVHDHARDAHHLAITL
jgi:nucleotide-binding universal stress UspA family protein